MGLILLVEDNEMNRDMLSRRLQRRGYQVITAEDGLAGLALAQQAAPDLILMDMSLPLLDGWETTRRLKAAPATQHIPVIGLTAHALSSDRATCLAAGCDEYEVKPLDFPRLLDKISALLNQSPAEHPQPSPDPHPGRPGNESALAEGSSGPAFADSWAGAAE